MKDIQVRTITGIIFLVAVIGSILLHPLAFLFLFAFFTIIGLREFLLLQKVEYKNASVLLFYLPAMLIYFMIAFIGLGYIDISLLVLGIPLLFLFIVFELYNPAKPNWQRIGSVYSAIVFVVVPFGLMNALFFNKATNGFQTGILIGLFIIMWSNDIFAYLIGSKFGKNRLFEKHSPKKSWEGSIGGFIFALIAAYVLSIFYNQLSSINWLILGAIIAISGTFGDLAESLLKRNAGVKDSGNLFPGHGGVLDRFDAVLFATPFVFVYLNLFS